ISAFGIAGLGHTLPEGGQAANIIDIPRCAAEESDHRHRRLLRARRERPGGRAAEQRYELAALHHSITSVARASRVGGTSMPSARAVCRLITNSNLVGCSTGRSAGRAPFRILSMKNAPRYQRSPRFTPYPIRPPAGANSAKPIEGRRLL